MEPAEVAIDDTFEHKATRRAYRVVGFCLVKDADSAVWHRGLAYIPLDNSTEIPYVRSVVDFLDKHYLMEKANASSTENFRGRADEWFEPGQN